MSTEKFEPAMDNMRVVIVGMLTRKIDKARENDEKTITIGIHDAAFLKTALMYHWKSESSKKNEEEK